MIVVPREPLTQVVFVHDYLQLRFQDDVLTIYNQAIINTPAALVTFKQPGFCDALLALIGQRVVCVSHHQDEPIRLTFESGVFVSVTSTGDGPEAFQFTLSGALIVDQN